MTGPPRKAPFAALLVILPVYLCFEFHEYFQGGMKLVASLLLSLAFVAGFATLAFRETIAAWARRLYGDGESFHKRLVIVVAIVLGSITHWHAKLVHIFYIQMRVPPFPANVWTIATYSVFLLACLWQFARPSSRASTILWIVLGWGLCLRILGIVFVTAEPNMADMLFCIEQSARALLAGHNPYALSYSWTPAFSFPLVYFPLYWLPFAPFAAVGLDIRWLNILSQVGLVLVFLRLTRGRWDDWRIVLVFTLFALMPDVIFSVVYRQVSLYWTMIALFVLFAWQQKWRAAGVLVSVLISMQIPAFVILFAYLIFLWKVRGPRAALLQGLFSAAFFLVTFTPFLSVGAATLKHDMFDYLVSLTGRQSWGDTLHGLSIGGVAKLVGLRRVLNYVQILGVLSVGAVYFFRKDDSFGGFLRAALFCYVVFLWFAPYVYIYYWFPAVLLGALLFLIEATESASAVREASSKPLAAA